MKLTNLFPLFLLLIATLFLISAPTATFAQATDDVPAGDASPVEGVGSDGAPIEESGGLPPEQAVNLITLVTGIAIGVVTGGGGALLIVLSIVHNLRNDRAMLTAIEGLTKSYPPETKDIWRKIGDGLNDASEVIKEVFDDVPMNEKPALTG